MAISSLCSPTVCRVRASRTEKYSGFEPEYFSVRDARTLRTVGEHTEENAILAAARLGNTRLIDNVRHCLNPAADWGMLAAR